MWTAAAGAVGGSIEDTSGRADGVPCPLGHAVERIRAAAEVVRALSFPWASESARSATPDDPLRDRNP